MVSPPKQNDYNRGGKECFISEKKSYNNSKSETKAILPFKDALKVKFMLTSSHLQGKRQDKVKVAFL